MSALVHCSGWTRTTGRRPHKLFIPAAACITGAPEMSEPSRHNPEDKAAQATLKEAVAAEDATCNTSHKLGKKIGKIAATNLDELCLKAPLCGRLGRNWGLDYRRPSRARPQAKGFSVKRGQKQKSKHARIALGQTSQAWGRRNPSWNIRSWR
jgi:hypothetical protein